ncbi:MAG: hypothetical protein R3349_11705, partial [Geminicoccaceae bacterium]|nr:hypothetical protein [Geminicoccaceae bacterium]
MALVASERLPRPAGARERRGARVARAGWRRKGLLLVVALPTVLAAVYYGWIASPVFISEAKFTIQGDQPAPGSAIELALFGTGGGEDALIVREYVRSHGLVERLGEQIDLRAMYGGSTIDPLQRLPEGASDEDLATYFSNMIELAFEPESSVTTLRVHAFRPDDARRIAAAIMELSEDLVNSLSQRVSEDMLGFAEAQLARAENRVSTARKAITAYRDRTDALDPTREAGAILGIIGDLEAKLAQERAELMELRSFLREDSARIAAVKARIAALASQIVEERSRLTGKQGSRLSEVVANYEELQLELEFAQNVYTTMLAALETARAEVQKQQKYLIRVVAPNLPDEPLEPDRVLGVLTVLVGSLLTY